jgi:glutamate synthase (ferredoxin)
MPEFWIAIVAALGAWVAYDVIQRKHAIIRNFPIIGHFRFWLEAVGPELRQYIVTDNNEERPFSRDQRRWVYASSKKENNYFGFGSDNEMETVPNYLAIKHQAFPLTPAVPGQDGYDPAYNLPCAKVLGGARQRAKAFRPNSVINISGMSFGSLSGRAVEALNQGSKLAGCLQNTGEGGISPHHRQGGELVWQIGTGYFGCRDLNGRFDIEQLKERIAQCPEVRAIEIKLSQGAKPGMGGLLPRAKITPEIARMRGIPLGRDCASPAAHTAFSDVDSLLDFVETLAAETELPVGIKSAVGESSFWHELARLMVAGTRGVDFITIDGGEGGTGAGPLVFNDHVALPFKVAFARVHRIFVEHDVHERVVFIGSGKLGFPEAALFAFSLGTDMISVAREAMLAIGCIQAQRCHTNHCPTGVTTQNWWLSRGLDPTLKSVRLANYVIGLRKELIALSCACGKVHPALVTADQLELLDGRFNSKTLSDVFEYGSGFGLPSQADCIEIERLMSNTDQATRIHE